MEGGKKRGDQHIRCLQCVREGVRIKQAIVKMAPKKKSQNKVYGSCCNLPGRGNHVGWTRSRRERGPLQPPPSCITASPIFGLHDSNNFFLASSPSPPQFHSRAITPFSPKELLTVHFPPSGKNAYFPFRERKRGREAGCLNLRGIAFCIHYTAKCGPKNSHRLREIA